MKLDLHLHSEFSWDSDVKIKDYIKKAENKKFSAISITDHNNTKSHAVIEELQNTTDVLLIPGQEISTKDGHLLVYGWINIPSGLSMNETVSIVKDQNGHAVAAHPYDPFRGGSFSKIFQSDILGFEVLNASAWFSFPNYLAKRAHRKHQGYAGVANSDSHSLDEFGSAYTVLPNSIPLSLDSIFENLHRSNIGGSRIGKFRKIKRLISRKLR